jgi:hemerythrin-like metal-binding protein
VTVAVWEPRLETGIDVIDAQHRALFAAVNDLAVSFKSGQATDKARDSLAFLAKYTVEHFQTEERFMKAMGYPNLPAHRVDHGRLVSKLQMLQVKQGKGYLVTAEVALFVADWLTHHIEESDMGYVQFAKAKIRG